MCEQQVSDGEREPNCVAMTLTNFLPNNKILDWTKLKSFADNKINVIEKLEFIFNKVENIVGK